MFGGKMTVDEGIAMQQRVEAHWLSIGDEKRRELQLAMKEAARKSADVAERIVRSSGFNKDNRTIFNAAEAEYELAAKAYYGE
jgi:hypothetical protein